jgi:hypothetical protein
VLQGTATTWIGQSIYGVADGKPAAEALGVPPEEGTRSAEAPPGASARRRHAAWAMGGGFAAPPRRSGAAPPRVGGVPIRELMELASCLDARAFLADAVPQE